MLFNNLEAIFFDFDGVLTDNCLLVDRSGTEFVKCSRSDGVAFDVLNKLQVPTYIISSESNEAVRTRGVKLKVPVFQGVHDKKEKVKQVCNDNNFKLCNVMFVGNDLNDFSVMKNCGFSACPSDAHLRIKEISTFNLKSLGGSGVAREIVEETLNLDIITILYGR